MTTSDQEFLQQYDITQYPKPSVTVDILIFTIDLSGQLEILLIERNIPPYKDFWSLPGGFVAMDETLEDAAKRKLKEELCLEEIAMEQLYTFGAVDRDPRTRVISVAYLALVPKNQIQASAGEGVSLTQWFPVSLSPEGDPDTLRIGPNLKLAFDHRDIVHIAIERMRGKISYTDLAFHFLKNPQRFAIYELQKIYEAILGQKMDTANFRRMFLTTYIKKGLAEATGEECFEYSRRSSQYYRLLNYKRT